jgi:hypothetical protein
LSLQGRHNTYRRPERLSPGAAFPSHDGQLDVVAACQSPDMTNSRLLRGIELRYAITEYLFQHGPKTVTDLIDALHHQGFAFAGRPSKAISDALRWEVGRGRVYRRRRGMYGPGSMPRATEYDIHKRVLALREEAALLSGRDDDAFWDALGA